MIDLYCQTCGRRTKFGEQGVDVLRVTPAERVIAALRTFLGRARTATLMVLASVLAFVVLVVVCAVVASFIASWN